MPAAGTIPPSGFPLSLTHATVPSTARAMLSLLVTSHWKKRAEGPRSDVACRPRSALRSRMAALAPFSRSMLTVARPRPEALSGLAREGAEGG